MSKDTSGQNSASLGLHDSTQHAQLTWECSNCKHREAVPPNFCPFCGYRGNNDHGQTEQKQDLPFCPRCQTQQIVPNPNYCVNPSCGTSFHLPSSTVSDVPPGFPPGIDMETFRQWQAQMMHQAGNNQQQLRQSYPITGPRFVFGQQHNIQPQFGIRMPMMPFQPSRMNFPHPQMMAWQTPDGYQYPQQCASAAGHPHLSPPPTEPLSHNVTQTRARFLSHLSQSPPAHQQTPPSTTTNRAGNAGNDGFQPSRGHVSSQNNLQSPPPGFPAGARPTTQLSVDMKSDNQLHSSSNTKSTTDSQGVMGSSNQAEQSAVRPQTESDQNSTPQGSRPKEEPQNSHSSEHEVQKDDTPVSPPSIKKENQTEGTEEVFEPKNNHFSEETGAQPPADQKGLDKQSEKEVQKAVVSKSEVKENNSTVSAKTQTQSGEPGLKEMTKADKENSGTQPLPDKKEGASEKHSQGTVQERVTSTAAQSSPEASTTNATETGSAVSISNDNPPPVEQNTNQGIRVTDQPPPLETSSEGGVIPAKNTVPSSYAAAAALPPTNSSETSRSGQPQQNLPGKFQMKSKKDDRTLVRSENKNQKPPAEIEIDRSGLQAAQDHSISITFHVIIPKLYWEWDSSSRVCIHFGDRRLGKWNDCGHFTLKREGEDGFCEMTCTFQDFDARLLKFDRAVPYKYVVHSQKKENKDDCYEYLHAYSGPDYNRCLVIPQDQLKTLIGGEYHQYDTIAYPKKTKVSKTFQENMQEKGLFRAVGGVIASAFTRHSKQDSPAEEEFTPLQATELSVYCLGQYLEHLREMLCSGNLPNKFDIHESVAEVAKILKCLQHRRIFHKSAEEKKIDLNKLKEVLKSWLEVILDYLQKNPLEDHAKQLVAVLFVIYCFGAQFNHYQRLESSFVVSIVKMITFHPKPGQKDCPEYQTLLKCLSPKHRKTACTYIGNICNRLTGEDEQSTCRDWLLALPFYHFMKGVSEPFCALKEQPEDIPWTEDESIGLKTIKEKAAKSERFAANYGILRNVLDFDPHVLYAFIYLCADKEFPALCELIPPYLSLSWLAHCAKNVKRMKDLEVKTWVENIRMVRRNHGTSTDPRDIPVARTVEASKLLCTRMFGKLKDNSKNSLKLLSASVECLLWSTHYLQVLSEHNCEQTLSDVFDTLNKTLKTWIAVKDVIGGSVFGATVSSSMSYLWSTTWKGKEELEVWQSLLSLEYPSESPLKQRWSGIIRSLVDARINVVSEPKMKIDLFCVMEVVKDIHPVLEEVVMDSAMKAIDFLQEKPFEQLESFASERVGRLFGKILLNKFPCMETEPNVTLDDLLTWHLWPKYIKIFESESKIRNGLSDPCTTLCACAQSQLHGLCESLCSGNITMENVKTINECMDQMKQLCSASFVKVKSSETKWTGDRLSYESVQRAIDERVEEFEHFSGAHNRLRHLCNHLDLNRAEIKGLPGLLDQLNQDFSKRDVCELCTRDPSDSSHLMIMCFQSAGTLTDFASHFQLLTTTYGSDLFSKTWSKNLRCAARDIPEFSVAHVHHHVWKPTLDHFVNLIHSLVSLTIKLSDVDNYFKDQEDLDTQLNNVFHGVGECTDTNHEDPTPIRTALAAIRNYWRFCDYCNGADVFLELRKVLNLQKGDFNLVEKFVTNPKVSMKDKTLKDVDSKLMEAGGFLDDIANAPEKKDCLKNFCTCQDLIKWLKDTAPKGVVDVQGFVHVALTTAAGGEDDFAHDRLHNLRTVGSGFASLIYEVKETDGYLELMHKCESLWRVLNTNRELPKLLVVCNENLQWYQAVKETQGDVETTSYGQMGNILKYGRYRVGAPPSNSAETAHDLISMKLTVKGKTLHKTSYSLDELRDLESKLVLICGNKADARAEVDHYLNLLHSVTRIAELYLELQQAGCVDYSAADLVFQCATYDVAHQDVEEPQFNEKFAKDLVVVLQNYTKKMEARLQDWRKTVRTARTKYYDLNYFTTLQLLHLRKELGLLCRSEDFHSAHVSSNVLMLLQSVSPNVSSSEVQTAVKLATNFTETPSLHSTTEDLSESDVEELTAQVLPDISITEPFFEEFGLTEEPTERPSSVASTSTKAEDIGLIQDFPSFKSVLTLSLDDLNEKQKQIMTQCTKYLGYTPLLVLQAFQECGLDAEMFEIEGWCEDHEDDFDEEEQEGLDSEPTENEEKGQVGSSSEESEEEDILIEPRTQLALSSSVASPKSDQKDSRSTLEIKTIVRQVVDESHPVVQKLLEADFDLDESIDAVQQHGELAAAMDYLASKDDSDEGDLFQPGEPKRRQLFERKEFEENRCDEELILEEHLDPNIGDKYLTLDQLGYVLRNIRTQLPDVIVQRGFTTTTMLKVGQPNLLVTSNDDVLRTVLGIYIEDVKLSLPLPTHEEVLVCNPQTTAEEVTLLWRRAIFDLGFKRIFCLAHAERLSYQVCDAALRSLSELSQGHSGYRLVIVCSKEYEEKSQMITRLHLYRRPDVPKVDETDYMEYLLSHFKARAEQSLAMASMVDPEMSTVRVVSSTRSGMGKSLYIQSLSKTLRTDIGSMNDVIATIPIHGPIVTPDTVLNLLAKHIDRAECTIYHLDIAPGILAEVDTILFCLLILRGLSDSRGNVWRCHPSQLYVAEVTVPDSMQRSQCQITQLLKLLPTVHCVSPLTAMNMEETEDTLQRGIDMEVYRGATFQRVYQYLRRDRAGKNLDRFTYRDGAVEGTIEDLLALILSKCGIRDPSWSEIHHFTKFLNIQLKACELSVFCDERLVGDVMSGLKSFVVKFMIRMSQDFSTPSLEGVVNEENPDHDEQEDLEKEADNLTKYQIAVRRKWEHCSHPYIFFNDDGKSQSITFVGFMVTKRGDLIEPSSSRLIEKTIMKPQLYTGLKRNTVNFDEDYNGWSKVKMIEKIATVMGIKHGDKQLDDPDKSYVLTSDNLVKILAIQMRFRCDIPVVIMGETGCGKTRLIRYMCDLAKQGQRIQNMLIMKIHGGITEKNVSDFIARAEAVAEENQKVNKHLDTVVFFDEANTTDSIGLIKEIMCDRRCNGRPISKDLKFIAACNPYRKHSKEMIKKLETAGLGFYVRMTETQQTLGKIPLRQLVYRVLDLPPSMRPLVYDFGQLNTGTEHDYTKQIVTDHAKRFPYLTNVIPAVAKVLAESQTYMREQTNECSFVSLRDVERAMIVFEYFYERMNLFAPLMNKKAKNERAEKIRVVSGEEATILAPHSAAPSSITRALVLSLSVCYHARLHSREPYERRISKHFRNPLSIPGGAQQFRDEIRWCQEVLLDNMILGPNIAKNAALRENVFMMAVCIELRIPLFLVGKPGSSKSLAKSIIQDSMLGRDSPKDLMKKFKQVHVISYQCSQLSTPESVIDVFKSAEKVQAREKTEEYVSVVVLDEVGLAEDSPNLPLKALHPLLEDGTEGAGKDDQQKIVEREKRVAFIGISNWALDPAKMNRGVMVTRGDPGKEELILSAQGICSNKVDDPVRGRLQSYFKPLSEAYMEICRTQDRQFFGLRDFYSLIKMLYWMCDKSGGRPLSWPQLEHAIKRNFGGLESEGLDPFEVFKKTLGYLDKDQDFTSVLKEFLPVINPDCSRQALIRTSLNTKDATWHGENRYLLFLTENYAALDILGHYLKVGDESTEHKEKDGDDEVISKPFILFGSSFPKDREYTQICRNINRIKICMETGRTVILLNLENLYESLYDVLNQYYTRSGDRRYVDLGLQTHRVKCRVHDNFKLILIAEKNTVYEKFPTPLINRLEKHFVLTSSVLEDWQEEILWYFEQWVKDFSDTSKHYGVHQFREAHAFIGFQKDTPAAVVFQATNQLKALSRSGSSTSPIRQQLLKCGILKDVTPEEFEVTEGRTVSSAWKQAVLELSQYLLLQTASDDALARLKFSKLQETSVNNFMEVYYGHQHHSSIGDFLRHHIKLMKESGGTDQLFIQVTTHSRLLTHEEVEKLSLELSVLIPFFDLHEFDTELDFSNKIGPAFLREEGQTEPHLIVIQCDSGHQNHDLIACARHRIYDESVRAKSKNKIQNRDGVTHVLFVVNLPSQEVKSPFVGFQSDPWISVHIDDLRQTSEATVLPNQAVKLRISELFIGKYDDERENSEELEQLSDGGSLMEGSESESDSTNPYQSLPQDFEVGFLDQEEIQDTEQANESGENYQAYSAKSDEKNEELLSNQSLYLEDVAGQGVVSPDFEEDTYEVAKFIPDGGSKMEESESTSINHEFLNQNLPQNFDIVTPNQEELQESEQDSDSGESVQEYSHVQEDKELPSIQSSFHDDFAGPILASVPSHALLCKDDERENSEVLNLMSDGEESEYTHPSISQTSWSQKLPHDIEVVIPNQGEIQESKQDFQSVESSQEYNVKSGEEDEELPSIQTPFHDIAGPIVSPNTFVGHYDIEEENSEVLKWIPDSDSVMEESKSYSNSQVSLNLSLSQDFEVAIHDQEEIKENSQDNSVIFDQEAEELPSIESHNITGPRVVSEAVHYKYEDEFDNSEVLEGIPVGDSVMEESKSDSISQISFNQSVPMDFEVAIHDHEEINERDQANNDEEISPKRGAAELPSIKDYFYNDPSGSDVASDIAPSQLSIDEMRTSELHLDDTPMLLLHEDNSLKLEDHEALHTDFVISVKDVVSEEPVVSKKDLSPFTSLETPKSSESGPLSNNVQQNEISTGDLQQTLIWEASPKDTTKNEQNSSEAPIPLVPWISKDMEDLEKLPSYHQDNPKLDLECREDDDSTSSVHDDPITKELKPEQFPFYPQHRRLHGCIQAAVSALKDSEKDRAKKRIKKLTGLIPSHPQDTLDDASFYSLLVKLVHGALKERERDRVDVRDWVGMEAMNAKKLQNGGTFRNVLARRIDEVITPLFSGIIALIDQNSNLDLIDESDQASPLSKFWHAMFQLVRFDSTLVALLGNSTVEVGFHCQLPFYWIILEAVEAQWATMDAGKNRREVHEQLCVSLSHTQVGAVLKGVTSEVDCKQFYTFYLHDFVKSVYKSKYKGDLQNKEHKLIADALNGMVHAPELCSMDEHESLIRRVTALHLVYNICRSEILWFGQLVLHNPGILSPLCSKMSNASDMILHLLAVEEVLLSIETPLARDEPGQNLQWWLDHVRLSQNVITSILSLGSRNDIALKLRLTWQKVRAVQMFVEHVFLPHSDAEGIVLYARRLNTRLSDPKAPPDFLKKATVEGIKTQLNSMDKRLKVDSAKKMSIRKSCQNFFMEIVSSLCFGGNTPPEPELINVLMDTILMDSKTRKLTPYKDMEPDDTPTIRSFLLQLLLEHNPEQVKQYLDVYFKRSRKIADPDLDQGLCLLCIQCFEDSLNKRLSSNSLTPGEQIHHTVQALREGCEALQDHYQSKGQVSLQYVEAVAKVRFSLLVVAEELQASRLRGDLLIAARELCVDGNFKITNEGDATGPVVYLLKLLVRRYGFPCLRTIDEEYPWVIPKDLRQGENGQEVDPFVIYQGRYTNLRDAVNTTVYDGDVTDLTQELQEHTDTALLMLSLYQQITLTHASAQSEKQITPEVIDNMNEFIVGCQQLSSEMKQVGRLLITNQHAAALGQMTISLRQPPKCKPLGAIVVHTASVILCRRKIDILMPFVSIFSNPAALNNAYLPTMKEDLLQEIKLTDDLEGAFYQCPNGHPYLIGNCGKPVDKGNCLVCNAVIGGVGYNVLAPKNSVATNTDTTKKGHDLGDPDKRPDIPERERHLSALAVCIVRAIMHSSFIWASCNNDRVFEALSQLVSPRVLPRNLPQYFWRHLERDFEQLSQITKRGADECAMIVHLVLRQILTTDPPTVGSTKLLNSKKDRHEWEQVFCESYIEPVLKALDKTMNKAMDLVANDDKQEHDQLFHLAYERAKVDEGRLEPHVWSFRSRITVDHLRNSIRKKEMVKILNAFLEAEPNLRATQYLPDIVKLQHDLFNKFHRRLEKSKAKTQTIRKFLMEIKNENTRNIYRKQIDSLKTAWALVGKKLKHHNRLPIEEKYLLPAITDDTELEYLIPTTMDEGRCTTSLVDFLVLTHNNFIETCRGLVSSGSSSAVWREHKVPITHIHRCHLLDYEQQLQSIILSHCHYSLTVGKGQDIKYDLPALEKHILNRFIYGKPMILLDIPHVAYRKDVYTAETFLAIRQKVKPQEAIPRRIQQDIITELRTPDRLRETLDIVEIVLGFLTSGGGNPKVPLKRYINAHKMNKKSFSAKAKEYCSLGHVISLWEAISVELARELWLAGQEPFESIPENYSQDLTDQDGDDLDKCLRTFDLGLLLGSLFEFIEVHVKHITAREEGWRLVDAMEVYRDQTEQDQLQQFSAEFPKRITVDQAVATWKHIVLYQEDLKHN